MELMHLLQALSAQLFEILVRDLKSGFSQLQFILKALQSRAFFGVKNVVR
jgi:hypothetical protein